MGMNSLSELLAELNGRFDGFIDNELAPFGEGGGFDEVKAYLSSKGIDGERILTMTEIVGNDPRMFVMLAYLCGFSQETMTTDLFGAWKIEGREYADTMKKYSNGNISDFDNEYQLYSYVECNRTYKGWDDAQSLDAINQWRTAHGEEPFNVWKSVNFNPTYPTVAYIAGRFNDYNGGDTPIEPQEVERRVIPDKYTTEVIVSVSGKYNKIAAVRRNYEDVYDDWSGDLTEYSTDADYNTENNPVFNLVYYETRYDWDEAEKDREKGLTPTQKAIYTAVSEMYRNIGLQFDKMETLLMENKIRPLHDCVATMERIIRRFGDTLRENGCD